MPTYDYECQDCGHRFELFQSITAPVKRKCPECGKRALERLIGTGAAILFKGDGFYSTDYRSKSYRDAAKADKPESAESGSTEGKGKGPADAGASGSAPESGKKSARKGSSTGKKSSKPES